MNRSKRNKLSIVIGSIILLGWTALVFMFSSQPYSKQSIQPLLYKLFQGRGIYRWMPDISFTYGDKYINARNSPYVFMEFLFRKAAHLFLYATLAAIIFMLMHLLLKGRPIYAFIVSMLVTGSVAAADEWNQLQQVHRSGSMTDIKLDLIGGLLGILAVLCFLGMKALWRRYVTGLNK